MATHSATELVTPEAFQTAIRQAGSDPAFDAFAEACVRAAFDWVDALVTVDLREAAPGAVPDNVRLAVILAARALYDMQGQMPVFERDAALRLIAPHRDVRGGADVVTPTVDAGNLEPAPAPTFRFYWAWSSVERPSSIDFVSVGEVRNDGTFEVPRPRITGNPYWSIWYPATVAKLVSAVVVEPPVDLLNRAMAAQSYVLSGAGGHFRRSMARVDPASLVGRRVRLTFTAG